jgi:acetate kinase
MGALLVLNAGSSSLKYAFFDPERALGGSFDGAGRLDAVLDALPKPPEAVAHRIVHGGPRFLEAARVTPLLLAELRRLSPFDPQHLPAEIALIEDVERRLPGVPQVACLDTAFHKDLPPESRLLPIPREYLERGARRYGFHGLSYASIVDTLRAEPAGLPRRLVVAHLGSGASVAAILDGRSVDTTMACTPASGIPMGRRSGDLDPGLLAFLGLSSAEWTEMVNARSGLLGMSGISADVRELLAREGEDARAAEALAVFTLRTSQAIAGMAAALGGVDALVFTGGIGENSAELRRRLCERLGFLKIASVRALRTDEEGRIAREARALLG